MAKVFLTRPRAGLKLKEGAMLFPGILLAISLQCFAEFQKEPRQLTRQQFRARVLGLVEEKNAETRRAAIKELYEKRNILNSACDQIPILKEK